VECDGEEERTAEALTAEWKRPVDHGAVITRYDLAIAQVGVETLPTGTEEATQCRCVEVLVPPGTDAVDLVQTVCEQTHGVDFLPGVEYVCNVRCVNRAGISDWSEASEGIFTLATCPKDVGVFQVQKTTATSLTVYYEHPHDNGSPLTHYHLRWRRLRGPSDAGVARGSLSVQTDSATVEAAPEDPQRFTLENLEPGTDYDIQASAANAVGASESSPLLSVATLPSIPDAPAVCWNPMDHRRR
jgi:hypothetical protein